MIEITVNGRFLDPPKAQVAMELDHNVEQLHFSSLPVIADNQRCYLNLMMPDNTADVVELTDGVCTITRNHTAQSGTIRAWLEIARGTNIVWHSDLLLLVVGELPDIGGAIEQQYPTALEQALEEVEEALAEAPTQITSQATAYQNSTSGTTVPTGTWQTTQPETPQGQYLWIRKILTWNNGQTTTLYSASRMGIDGSGSVVSVNNVSPDANGNVTLPVDATPTSGSTNPVTSGGVYTALAAKAPLASPQFSGSPTAPTPVSGTDNTRIATTAFVNTALANNSGLSMPILASVSTVAELNSALDAALNDMPEGGILHLRVNTTAAFGLFVQNAVYFGVLYKSALNQYCHVMLYPNYILAPISGVRLANGWSYTRLLTNELTTTTLTATLRDGGTSGTVLATGTATIKRNEGFIDFKLAITNCDDVSITGASATITFDSALPSQIPAYFPIIIRKGGQSYFIATAQNLSTYIVIRGGDFANQSNPRWTFDSANTAIYAHEFVAI